MDDMFLVATAHTVDPDTGDYLLEPGSKHINLCTSLTDVDLKTVKNTKHS
jgi:hypothetical protein